jgi:anhydro-N-acetylmuramic acid kinase
VELAAIFQQLNEIVSDGGHGEAFGIDGKSDRSWAARAAKGRGLPQRNARVKAGPVWAMGLMSGTSMDGVDAALIRTDGETVAEFGPALSAPYPSETQGRFRALLDAAHALHVNGPLPAEFAALEAESTGLHAGAVAALLTRAGLKREDIRVIGYHGQTVLHRPHQRQTLQLGSGAGLARAAGVDVVNDFRSADVRAGGQGAPLVPLYHQALVRRLKTDEPIAVLNIGGVANVTFVGPGDTMLAFDTGPGNALIDDWARRHTGQGVDLDGRLAAAGKVDEARLHAALAHPFFAKPGPKSLDRLDFTLAMVAGLSPQDGAATLTAFTAASIAEAIRHAPERPSRWIVCGGGRRNPVLLAMLRRYLGNNVQTAEDVGWRGDDLEAEAFAFLAVRAVRGLPLSLPTTTGVPRPMTGGVYHKGKD